MYFYLYDSFLQDKKYDQLISDIEARCIDLSIQGKTSKMNILNNMKELISDAVKIGAQTVVILGDDKTVGKAINAVVDLHVTLGIIPAGEGSHTLAAYLGIPQGLLACEVLSRRVKEQIDVGCVNGNYFAFYLKSLSPFVKIVSSDNEYSITPLSQGSQMYICNFKPPHFIIKTIYHKKFFSPQDGFLEVVIDNKGSASLMQKFLFKKNTATDGYTILPFKRIKLTAIDSGQEVRLILDGEKIIKSPADIKIIPKAVTIIVGKERIF